MSMKIKVLVVDDDMINLMLIKTLLKKSDHIEEVIEAKNGLEAINTLKERNDVNLILLDILMPVMNGIEFLITQKSDNNISNIPVVVLTTDETKREEALNNGAFDFLVKPIREPQLMEKINRIVEIIEG